MFSCWCGAILLVWILVLGHILAFAFGVFGRFRSCPSFAGFRLSLLASTRIVLLSCVLCLLLCGIGGVVLVVVFFLAWV